MIKICSKLLTLSLKLIFNSMLQKSVFPENCKKYNAVPISKKDSKKIRFVINYAKNFKNVLL